MLDKLMVKLLTLKTLLSSERGQDVMEYALLAGVIAATLLVAAGFLSGPVQNMFTNIGKCITFDSACKGLPIGP
jgi:Flp pilus assembly pilin Flp